MQPEEIELDWIAKLAVDRILVTGGGSGIGRATALELASAGATVYILGRNQASLEETVRQGKELPGRIVPVTGDVRDPDAVERAFKSIEADGGPVEGLVHGAASPHYQPAEQMTSSSFREVMESILLGSFHVVHRWGTALLRAGRPGRAVAITSAIASKGTPGAAHSSASKAGVEAMVKTLAREWGPAGLVINAVGPGFFPVERTQAMYENSEVVEKVSQQAALGRPGQIHEAVGPIVFLLTEGASFMTGQVVVTDGGFTLTPSVLPKLRFSYGGEKA